jgi:hypothetical protein
MSTPIKFRTAHGYLSFQKPTTPEGAVTVQYRPAPDAAPNQTWEEVYLDGIEALFPEPAPPPSGVPPPVEDQVPDAVEPVAQDAAYIGRVKAYLESLGENLSGPCGAFTIVEHAAWYLHFTFPGVGLLDKPGGNNCRSYATDVLIAQGHIVDILTDAGNINGPTWAPEDVPADMTRWRPPYDPTTVTSAVMSTASEMDEAAKSAKKKK